ncbi:hypothetical protein ACFLU6_09890, partial [Acidobacteriota bacterium]
MSFFLNIVRINMAFVTLLGLGLFSSVITEEKEEMTLGLLKMTALTPLALLLGKSTSRLMSVLLIICAQVPFVLLGVTLGGISVRQVMAAYCTILAWTVLLSGAALLCSVISPRTAVALGLMLLFLLVFFAFTTTGPWFFETLLQNGVFNKSSPLIGPVRTLSTALTDASPLAQIERIMTTGFTGSPVGFQVVTNVACGVLFFLLAWAAFEPFTREQLDLAPTRSVPLPRASTRQPEERGTGIGRTWSWALTWKDFHFIGGGTKGLVLKTVILGVLTALIVYLTYMVNTKFDRELTGAVIMISMLVLAYFDLTIYTCRCLHEEARWQTLPIIMMLPISAHRIFLYKFMGGWLTILPALAYFLLGLAVAPASFMAGYHFTFYTAFGVSYIAEAAYFFSVMTFFALVLKRAVLVLGVLIYVFSGWVLAPVMLIITMMAAMFNLAHVGIIIGSIVCKGGAIVLLQLGIF